MSLLRVLPFAGSLAVLAACAPATPPSPVSAKESSVNTSAVMNETRTPKRSMDGSVPFTMPEIEERLLQVFALPPEQISKQAVEKIFGVALQGEDSTFYEEISDDRQVAFGLMLPRPLRQGWVFSYTMYIKKMMYGQEAMGSEPEEIPDAYKFSYIDFAKQLEARGWKAEGGDFSHGRLVVNFKKNGYLMDVYIDTVKGLGPFDYSQTKVSRIVIKATK